jgi:hypothetical protein
MNPILAITATGKPLSKASKGGDCDLLWVREDFTESEVLPVSGNDVLIG